VRMSVGIARDDSGLEIGGVIDADGTDLAERLVIAAREQPAREIAVPRGLAATLRPYQLRGYAWLVMMGRLGLGACLADDMGLGKSVQALAAILQAREQAAEDSSVPVRPSLIVAPTSVLTNWRIECERFTPDLPVRIHHGSDRPRGDELIAQAADVAIVITSYALLARDAETLAHIDWHTVVLDEAQQIKNPTTRHARAARMLSAQSRVALTGTPVENHVGDLWSIMHFLNPSLLGSRADFRRRYMLPIQSGDLPEVVDQLRRVTAPFVLRREKSDPTVISDLPDKLEFTSLCTLTTEQASLYEAIVRDAAKILRMPRKQAGMSGIERRGMILATIARLKQACNHPAQLLSDGSALGGRSGKLARLEELLETVLDSGERALVFTQFVAMGELLTRHLYETFGREVAFLHGGCSRAERDRIVERFQNAGPDGPPILVLSLKAGGSGLNLTAATHVFHYDRWWNPAVEQQATDRAFRIGQTRDVQVHTLVCAGTVEEQIDRMLEQKRKVATSVVGGGEQWIGELEDDALLDLLKLRRDTLLQDGALDTLEKEWGRATL
ncbi:MAG: DEAD/DEAH box helicase, partial [Gaiellales bacterium]